ncbi:type IV pilus twitching motility protein PilT [soil metagenome]
MQNQPPIQRPGVGGMPGAPGQMPGTPGQLSPSQNGGAGALMANRAGYNQPDVFRGDVEDEKEEQTGPLQSLDDLHIDELLHIVVDKGSSDLHICQNSQPIIRLDGKLKPLHFEKFTPGQTQRMLYDILSDDNINKFETTWELDFSYQLPRRARFRVNLYREKGATAAAFRLIPQKIPTVEQLNLPPILKSLCEKPRGLVLVTGPTGSGKSTSLAAMINYINENHAHHIITIEDPIEYLHEHKKSIINQREVGADTKSFLNALRGSLREDPDILLVGEMRDIETISLAVTAAETGHLVFATLHTNTAAESIDRMVDVFPPEQQEQIRVQISNNIIAVVAQQLLPRAGAKGRVPANEVMIASSAIRNLIREAKTHQITSMIQMSANVGMFTMDQNLRDLYLKGLITLDDAYSRCVNKDELTKMINTPQGGPGGAQPGMGPGVRPMPQGR